VLVSLRQGVLAYPASYVQTSSGNRIRSIACGATAGNNANVAAVITCTLTMFPDESGLGEVEAYFVSPQASTVLPLYFAPTNATMMGLTDKNETVALLTSFTTVPKFTEAGAYSIAFEGPYRMKTFSRAGSVKYVNAAELTDTLPGLQIASRDDVKAPAVSKFYCNVGKEVRLKARSDVAVSCAVQAADEQSGVSYVSLQYVSPSRRSVLAFSYTTQSPGLGSRSPAVINTLADTVSENLGPATEPGAWTLLQAVASDNRGNYYNFMPGELNQKAVQTFFLVQGVSRTFTIQPRDGSDGEAAVPAGSGAATLSTSIFSILISTLLMLRFTRGYQA
jgi:hypothetical protein